MRKAIRKFAQSMNVGFDKVVPDSFIFAILLTFIVFILGIVLAGKNPFQMTKFWAEGFWKFLTFGMQMVLILVTGYTLATTPAGQKGLAAIARIPKSGVQATIFIMIVSAGLAYISWGLGIVGSAVLARELAKNLKKADFKLLVAAGYCGSMVGTMGLSFSEALLVNTPGHFMEKQIGLIPYSQTVFSAQLLVPTLLCAFIVLPIFFWLIHPEENDTPEIDPAIKARFEEEDRAVKESAVKGGGKLTVAERLDNSPVINIAISVMGFVYIIYWFSSQGFNLTLDIFNFTLLFLGILLHWTPKRLLTAFQEGVRASYGIVLQFPFYAGIQGMMASSGLIAIMAGWFVSISTAVTFPIWTYLSTAVVNFFVPSSGGIFMVQGPIMVKAGQALGVSAATIVNSFSAGEVIGNMFQPFWAIPLLGMAGLKMRDITGFCILCFLVTSVFYLLSFLLF